MSVLSAILDVFRNLAGQPTVVDRRRVPRRLYMRQGYLTFLGRPAHPPADCLIRNLSPAGAQIELQQPGLEEELFVGPVRLCIMDKRHERDAKIVWRHNSLIGLKFEGNPLPLGRDYRHETQRGRG